MAYESPEEIHSQPRPSRGPIVLIVAVIALLVLGILAVGGYFVYRRLVAPPDAAIAACLPANTLFLSHLPNAAATGTRYMDSDLRKLVENKELSDGFGALMGLAMQSAKDEDKANMQKVQDTLQLFLPTLSGETFIAVTGLADDNDSPLANNLIAGCKPAAGYSKQDEFTAKVKSILIEQKAPVAFGTGTVNGVNYEYIVPKDREKEVPKRFCQAKFEGWILFSLGEKPLADFIDRYKKTTPVETSLSKLPAFIKVQDGIAPSPVPNSILGVDADLFINVDAIRDLVAKKIASGALPATASQAMNGLAMYGALGASVAFEKGMLQDRWFIYSPVARRPDLGKWYDPCAYSTVSFTSPDTILYGASSLDLKAFWNAMPVLFKGNPDLDAAKIQDYGVNTVKGMGLDFDTNLLNALGNEMALVIDWPQPSANAANPLPGAGFIITLAKPADFQPARDVVVDMMATEAQNMGTVADQEVGDYKLKFVVPMKKTPFLDSPTIITSGPVFGLFTTREAAIRMLAKHSSTVKEASHFEKVSSAAFGTSTGTMYMDLSTVIARAYPIARPMLDMGLKSIPNGKDIVLPETLTFPDDLSAWAAKMSVDKEGYSGVSLSSIGNQFFPLTIGGSGALGALQALGSGSDHATPAPSAANPKSAEAVHAALVTLRISTESWAAQTKAAPGTEVKWTDVVTFIPYSPLSKSEGKDALGNPYDLGVVGQRPPDVSAATKAAFPDKDASFWAPEVTSPEPSTAPPVTPAPAAVPPASGGLFPANDTGTPAAPAAPAPAAPGAP